MKKRKGSGLMFLAGVVIGAGATSLFNRQRIAATGAKLRDRADHLLKVGTRETRKAAKRYWKNAYGQVQETRARMTEGKVPDDILEERVKAQIGHALSPRGLAVRARDGHVVVDGVVAPGEKQKLAERLKATRGVHSFDVQVEEQNREDTFPVMQGGSRARRKVA